MSTSASFVRYLHKKWGYDRRISMRAMFGEYALYCECIVVALICNEVVYIKNTPGTQILLATICEMGPPYPGAKLYYILSERQTDDYDFMMKVCATCMRDVVRQKSTKRASSQKKKFI
jgi:TfoX/Sxy family transcriptional regulator of competence genes